MNKLLKKLVTVSTIGIFTFGNFAFAGMGADESSIIKLSTKKHL